MTTPSEPDFFDGDETLSEIGDAEEAEDAEEAGQVEAEKPETVVVPVRLGDGVSTLDKFARVEAEHARQWDARACGPTSRCEEIRPHVGRRRGPGSRHPAPQRVTIRVLQCDVEKSRWWQRLSVSEVGPIS